jgi:hypothetical protein
MRSSSSLFSMAESSVESRKRSRESANDSSSESLGFQGRAFDEDLSGEFGSEDSEPSLGTYSEAGAAGAQGRQEPHVPAERANVYRYDVDVERMPSDQAPRAPRAQPGQAAGAPRAQPGQAEQAEQNGEGEKGREQEGMPASDARRDGLGSGVEAEFGGGGFGNWDEDLGGEFEADLYDDEETAAQAKQNPAWARRTERELREWRESRHLFAAALLRQQAAGPEVLKEKCSTPECTGVQVVRCLDCFQGQPVCSDCDRRLHPHAHFHQREYLTFEGRCWQPIGPDFEVRGGKLERCAKVFAKSLSAACARCGVCSWGPPQATNKPLTVVTLAGRFDFVRATFACQTKGCGCSHEQDSLDAVDLGAWPGTVSECRTVYDVALLNFWDKMSKDQPGASIIALVKVLEGISRDHGRVRKTLF